MKGTLVTITSIYDAHYNNVCSEAICVLASYSDERCYVLWVVWRVMRHYLGVLDVEQSKSGRMECFLM